MTWQALEASLFHHLGEVVGTSGVEAKLQEGVRCVCFTFVGFVGRQTRLHVGWRMKSRCKRACQNLHHVTSQNVLPKWYDLKMISRITYQRTGRNPSSPQVDAHITL